jgi:hypothetical protein
MDITKNQNNINRYANTPINEFEEVKAAGCELQMVKHQSLLFEIANNFGFAYDEASRLIEHVNAYASREYKDENNCLPLRVLLAKAMVHKCIFKISCRMFNEHTVTGIQPWPSYHASSTSFEGRKKEMPLSYLTVYILSSVIGFSEQEIASILNTSAFQVKERLTRALMITKQ